MRTLAVTAYTPGYSDLRIRLESSCIAHGVDLLAVPYESSGDWTRNGHVKPRVLLEARTAHPSRPVVWIDADAILRATPLLLDFLAPLGADAAYHVVPKTHEALSGTVWVNSAESGKGTAFLREWAALCERSPDVWDQKLMGVAGKLTGDVGGLVLSLPAEYCWIDYFGEPRWGGPRDPVVEHTQASRDVRAGKRAM